MNTLPLKIALVTGASSGIGKEISKAFVKKGMTVIGVSRNMDKMQDVENGLKEEKGTFLPYQCDVTNYDKVYKMFEFIKKNHSSPNICVNSAGTILRSSLLDGNPEEWNGLMNLHLISRILICQLTVKSLQERGINEGHLFNISSMAGQKVLNFGFTHFYSCTKFALHAASEGLRKELKLMKSNIKVTEIIPGLTNTPLIDKMPIKPEAQIGRLLPEEIALCILQTLELPLSAELQQVVIGSTVDTPM